MKKYLFFILLCLSLYSCRSISINDKINFNESEDWYFAGGNSERTNISKSKKEIVPPLKLIWKYNTESAYSKYSISVCDGIVFTSNLKGDIFAIDIYSGSRIGSFGTKGKASYSTPVIFNNNIIVSSAGGEKNPVLSYNYINGDVNWEKNIGDVYSSPILLNDYIYITTYDGNIHKLNAKTGLSEWNLKSNNVNINPGPFYSGPTAGNNNILAGNTDGNLYALDEYSGKIKWIFNTKSQIYCEAAFKNNRIYFGSNDGYFYCLDTNSSLIWKKELKTKFQSSPAFNGDFVFIAGIDGLIYALDINDGSEKWSVETKGAIWASPLIHKNLIFIGSYDNYFYCLNAENGKILWRYLTEGRIRNSAVIWKEYVVVGCDDKQIYCFK